MKCELMSSVEWRDLNAWEIHSIYHNGVGLCFCLHSRFVRCPISFPTLNQNIWNDAWTSCSLNQLTHDISWWIGIWVITSPDHSKNLNSPIIYFYHLPILWKRWRHRGLAPFFDSLALIYIRHKILMCDLYWGMSELVFYLISNINLYKCYATCRNIIIIHLHVCTAVIK